jgi:hypothetical protein
MNVTELREGIGAALATISGLRVTDHVAGQVNPPAALVGLPRIEWDQTMARGSDLLFFDIRLFVSGSYNRTATDLLSAYLAGSGPRSVKQALESDITLDGACDSVRVLSAESGWVEHGGGQYLVADFELEVVG